MQRLCLLTAGIVAVATAHAQTAEKHPPNVIVILTDDHGYADLGCQGSPDVKTPHIDSLANNGVRFTNGYVTAPQCAPSRAGLLTGRYQNRFGLESNEFAYNPGLPRTESLISDRMKALGYTTGYVGKWGVTSKKHSYPPQRGFDESFWNQDGNRYFPDSPSKHNVQMYRGNDPVDLEEYSTDAFGREAVEFIDRNRDKPYFLFVSFITPHEPMEAKEEDLARFPDVEDPQRKTTLAMLASLDDNVGKILEAVRESGRENDTLIFFVSDNGGYPGNASSNYPFSGTKSQMLEGGIRVPFIVQWKDHLTGGKVFDQPVSALDILPTAVAAAGGQILPEWKLDGVNLLPYLSGQETGSPHDVLFWKLHFPIAKMEQHGWAVRQGDWKLVRNGWAQTPVALHNLKNDPGEKQNLAAQFPEKVTALRNAWEAWDAGNVTPGSVD